MGIRRTKGHILLVEDTEIIATNVKQLLNNYGYKVTVCKDTSYAPTLLSYMKDIDLIISDNDMPGVADAGMQLAKNPARHGIPLLLWSGAEHVLELQLPPNTKAIWKETYGLWMGQPFITPGNQTTFLNLVDSMIPERSKAASIT